jgi:hypothetical protein
LRKRSLTWAVAAVACAVVAAGVAILWRSQGPSLGVSVGLPAAATLLTSVVAWATSVQQRTGQTTVEQVKQAREALAERALVRLRGSARAPSAADLVPSTFGTLAVRWIRSDDGQPHLEGNGDNDVIELEDVGSLSARLRSGRTQLLAVLGPAGCGKTVLARTLMAELLARPAQPGRPVPVLASFRRWSPQQYSLRDWMARCVLDLAPELRDKSVYGPDIVESLIYRGAVLFVLDGLDVLPAALRREVLTSDEVLHQDRLILTCRTEEFRAAHDNPIANLEVVTPRRVPLADAKQFLRQCADDPQRWDPVFDRAEAAPDGALALALRKPHIIYLANSVYRRAAGQGGDAQDGQPNAASGAAKPPDLADLTPDPPLANEAAVTGVLLKSLVPALLPHDDTWARSSPWYYDRAQRWLSYLARKVCASGASDFAWSEIFRAAPRLARLCSALRAVFAAAAVFVVMIFIYRSHGHFDTYGYLTGAAYAAAVASACVFLAPSAAGRTARTFRRPVYRWWLGQRLASSWRILGAGFVTFVFFGSLIGLRVSLQHGHAKSTGISEGIVAGLVVCLAAVIAKVPVPTRNWAQTLPGAAAGPGKPADPPAEPGLATGPSLGATIAMGIAFGLLSGALAYVKNHTATGPTLRQALEYGIIMGLNFAVGAWLVSWARTRLLSRRLPDPLAALRGERYFTLLAVVILGLTFGTAFGLDAKVHWTSQGGIANGLVGVIVASLVSDWPLYVVVLGFLALRGRLPFRLGRFLEMCRAQGALRPLRGSYQFCADPAALGLLASAKTKVPAETTELSQTTGPSQTAGAQENTGAPETTGASAP